MKIRFRLSLPDGAHFTQAANSTVVVTGLRGRTELDFGSNHIATVFLQLGAHDISESEIYSLASALGGPSLERTVRQGLVCLKQIQAVAYQVDCERSRVLQVLPLQARAYADGEVQPGASSIRLASDAYLQAGASGLRVLVPLAAAEVVVESCFAAGLVEALGRQTPAVAPNPPLELIQHVLHMTGHLANSRGANSTGWPFADLLFHSSSRMGSTWGQFGRRYARAATSSLPVRSFGKPIDLPGDEGTEPPGLTLRDVLHRRRSGRTPARLPLTIAQLAGFLSLAVRPTWDEHVQRLRYPYPSGGGIYGYNVYAALHRCDRMAPGIYRYDAIRHQLEPRATEATTADVLARHGGAAMGLRDQTPDAVLIVTADFGSFSERYDAIAYRLILLGAGGLIQNMYLAAAALKLTGCALGGGNAVLFAEASGAHLAVEPSIVEFALSGGLPD